MARYIKVNPKVAQYLHLESDRNRVKDGNYLLWQADILPFGRLTELPEILERIGGVALLAGEARQEQDGTVIHELPEATDEAFKIVVVKQPEKETDTDNPEVEQPAGDSAGNGGTGEAVEGAESEKGNEETAEPAQPKEEQTDKNE
ncbi:MAG: hypothetical protein [Bacteriophage sp.]|jgi:hypothetical protein|nr:MAG: hypothetical protein [Bacteriophage sp.]